MADFCLVRPANDAPALDLSTWCTNVAWSIPAGGHTIAHDLSGTAATRAAVESAMGGTRCILFFGHGSYTELLGAGHALVDTANVSKASGSIVVAIACSSASILGPDAIRQGVEAWLGLDDRFVWLSRDPDRQFEPAAVSGIKVLIAGKDAGDALAAMRQNFTDVVDYYTNGAGKGKTNSTVGWLSAFWDLSHLALIGNLSAVL